MRRGVKAAVWALFVLYGLVMLWLLFLSGRHPEFLRGYVENGIYWSLVRSTTNLVPFRTVADFLENIASGNDYLVRHAVVNLAGNVVMFAVSAAAFPEAAAVLALSPRLRPGHRRRGDGAGAAHRRLGGRGRPHFEPLRRVDRFSLRSARR